jgi:uncharacterized Ntn-hydrolase superfamily protein
MFGRSRFAKLADTQLDVFVREHQDVLEEVRERLEAYNRTDRSEAEELYGDYVDTVDAITDALDDLRDRYAATLDEAAAEEYELAFNRAVERQLPRFGLEIEET